MHIVLLVPEYIAWHYTEVVRLWLNIVSNFMWFTLHFFSMPVMFHRFLKPIPAKPLATLVTMFGRIVVILIGSVFCLAVFVAGLFLTVFWLLLPVLAFTFFVEAVVFFISFMNI